MPYARPNVGRQQNVNRFQEEILNVHEVASFLRDRNVTESVVLRVTNELNAGSEEAYRDVMDYYQRAGFAPPVTRAPIHSEPVLYTVTGSVDTCSRCGDFITDQGISWNDKKYHVACFTVHALNLLPNGSLETPETRCAICSRPFNQYDQIANLFFGPVHRDCLRNRWTKIVCDECGTVGHAETMKMKERGSSAYLCPTCYSHRVVRCHECGVAGHVHNFVEFGRDGFMCASCAEKYTTCSNCGAYFITNSVLKNLCFRCHAAVVPSRRLHRYNFKPKPRFHGRVPVQYGLELEVDKFPNRDMNRLGLRALHQVEKGETSFYIKTDGSLTDGYELVFHPRELSSWLSYKDKLDEISGALIACGAKSYETTTCGIHVHRGRTDITAYHIVKINFVLARFRSVTRAVAMRNPNHYAKEFPMVDHDNRKVRTNRMLECFKLAKLPAHRRRYDTDRYLQLNIQNENTIELRIFRGNLNVTTILANIMFFDRLVEFTRKQTIKEINKMTDKDMAKLFDGFCQNMMTQSTLGRRRNNKFTKVGWEVTNKLSSRLAIVHKEEEERS